MRHSLLLWVDALVNFALGILVVLFPRPVVAVLGVPQTETAFYPSVFGAVLCGIGLALLIEWRRKPGGSTGLGLGGAVAINLCGGIVLAAWFLFGGLEIPLRGRVFLWSLVGVLIGISSIEAVMGHGRQHD